MAYDWLRSSFKSRGLFIQHMIVLLMDYMPLNVNVCFGLFSCLVDLALLLLKPRHRSHRSQKPTPQTPKTIEATGSPNKIRKKTQTNALLFPRLTQIPSDGSSVHPCSSYDVAKATFFDWFAKNAPKIVSTTCNTSQKAFWSRREASPLRWWHMQRSSPPLPCLAAPCETSPTKNGYRCWCGKRKQTQVGEQTALCAQCCTTHIHRIQNRWLYPETSRWRQKVPKAPAENRDKKNHTYLCILKHNKWHSTHSQSRLAPSSAKNTGIRCWFL